MLWKRKKQIQLQQPWTFVSESSQQRYGDFPGGPMVRTWSFHGWGARVQSLVRKLRSHNPSREAKKKKGGLTGALRPQGHSARAAASVDKKGSVWAALGRRPLPRGLDASLGAPGSLSSGCPSCKVAYGSGPPALSSHKRSPFCAHRTPRPPHLQPAENPSHSPRL